MNAAGTIGLSSHGLLFSSGLVQAYLNGGVRVLRKYGRGKDVLKSRLITVISSLGHILIGKSKS